MIISLNWLKRFIKIDMPVDELVTLIGARLVEVESVVDIGAKYVGVVVVKIAKVMPHPDADKLHVVHVDDGGVTPNVVRLENGLIEVVCGAPNVQEGLVVAWLPPGSTVPNSYDKEPFVLEARALRGVVSNGMLASAKVLAIGDDHDGIAELDQTMAAGTSFAEAYLLNDYLLDIENKSLTHRPDCFGIIGFAREVAAITGQTFVTPEWLAELVPDVVVAKDASDLPKISAHVEGDVSARYQLVALQNIDATKKSTFAMQTWLARIGTRPIGAVVDITNYLMYTTGQPMHAFDLDKVMAVHPQHSAELVVRESREGETLTLLDGRTINLSNSDIVICAGDTPIALAGAMGGASTEIDSTTTRVLLEVATFDLYRLRTTQMRHAIYSEAITRFTKGQAADQTAPVLAEAVHMLRDIVGGEAISEVVDVETESEDELILSVSAKHINAILGADYSIDEIAGTLARAEFVVAHDGEDTLQVTAPYWRQDIHIVEDIAEEVGRINGFDAIAPVLPQRPFRAVMASEFEQTRSAIRSMLKRSGANEILTYNFVSGALLQKTGESAEPAYHLVNSLSPELAYLRTSLLPSVLAKVHANHKLGYDEFALFELNKTHTKRELNDENLPLERQMLGFAWSATDKVAKRSSGAAFYQAKHFLEYLADSLRVNLRYEPLHGSKVPEWLALHATVYEPQRAAVVHAGDIAIGIVGEIRAAVRTNLKLPQAVAGFEIEAELLHAARMRTSNYKPLSRYPGTTRDISVVVDNATTYESVVKTIQEQLALLPVTTSLVPIGIHKKTDADEKTITLRISFVDSAATIDVAMVNKAVDTISSLRY